MDKINSMLKGKKTITSAITIAIVAILQYLKLIDQATASLIFEVAGALGLYGVYDKMSR